MTKNLRALALSALLVGNSAAACDDLYRIDGTDQDQDGNTTFRVTLTEHARENPTDAITSALGRCFLELMAGSPSMAAVVADGRHFDINQAAEMADF